MLVAAALAERERELPRDLGTGIETDVGVPAVGIIRIAAVRRDRGVKEMSVEIVVSQRRRRADKKMLGVALHLRRGAILTLRAPFARHRVRVETTEPVQLVGAGAGELIQ